MLINLLEETNVREETLVNEEARDPGRRGYAAMGGRAAAMLLVIMFLCWSGMGSKPAQSDPGDLDAWGSKNSADNRIVRLAKASPGGAAFFSASPGALSFGSSPRPAREVYTDRLIKSVTTINATNYSVPTYHTAIYTVVNGNAQNITLPNPNLLPAGDEITIIDGMGQAASNTIAVNSTNTTGAANVNGAAFVNITTAYGQRTYTQQGGRWLAR